ncbi:MAG TPA: PP2C family protein-serine/threonine phosphatase [Candidatus Sulfotelmatobacter sp.]|nr:PP2C family protein-serine/threonine phosphatase [Candidatus Sulfotelmatobacter sp.]
MFWVVPLWTIPFGVFFGLIYGKQRHDFVDAYEISLVFSLSVCLFLWVTKWFVLPLVLPSSGQPGPRRVVRHILLFSGATVLGTIVAALVLHFTIVPQMLGSARSVATLGMFTLLFLLLISGILTALRFYRDALERARSDHELTVARRIQSSFLISEFPPMKGLEVHALNVPSRSVSGDFYDVVSGFGGSHLLAVADVAGKGVPAALLTSMLQASLRMQAQENREVSDMLARINSLVYRSTEVEQFATFFLARVEEETLHLCYSNAGHNIPVVFQRDGGRRMLERGGTVVGILEHCAFEEETVRLAAGDRVVLYSDGITEAAREDGEMFGEHRLYEAVERLPLELEARAVTAAILEEVRRFLSGNEPGDDMTVMVLRALPAEGSPPA